MGFPLFKHQTGQWAKKVRGKLRYFGSWKKDPSGKEAIERWLQQKDRLIAGKDPEPSGATVDELVNRFLAVKDAQVDSGEIGTRSFDDLKQTGKRIIRVLGRTSPLASLSTQDFELLRQDCCKGKAPTTAGNEIGRCRMFFRYSWYSRLTPAPLPYEMALKKPTARVRRLHRQRQPKKLLSRERVLELLRASSGQMKAMILLGLNCGFGPTDCASLEGRCVQGEWVHFPRPKTGIERTAWLWPETAKRLKPHLADGLVFKTKYGRSWHGKGRSSPISAEFRKLGGAGFYCLRHTFQTVAEESKDFPAVKLVMGHVDPSISAAYREEISEERIRAVCEHVRNWLFRRSACS